MDIICNVGRILQKSANIGVASSRVHQKQQTEKGEWLAVASFKQVVRQSASLFREIAVYIQHTRKQPAATGNCNAPQVFYTTAGISTSTTGAKLTLRAGGGSQFPAKPRKPTRRTAGPLRQGKEQPPSSLPFVLVWFGFVRVRTRIL